MAPILYYFIILYYIICSIGNMRHCMLPCLALHPPLLCTVCSLVSDIIMSGLGLQSKYTVKYVQCHWAIFYRISLLSSLYGYSIS